MKLTLWGCPHCDLYYSDKQMAYRRGLVKRNTQVSQKRFHDLVVAQLNHEKICPTWKRMLP